MQCVKCNRENVAIAKFCKYCGTAISNSKPVISLGVSIDELVGLDDLKKELQELQAILEGKKQHGTGSRHPYNTILIGSSGTAKTLISNLIAELFLQFGMISKNKPYTVDGEALENMQDDSKGLQKLFEDAKGGMLFVDNTQKLVNEEGKASAGFERFINRMEQYKDDPIVLMAGLPFGLKAFSRSKENQHITGRFRKIHIIPDYTPDQYKEITEFAIKRQGFTLCPEASEKILKRFRFLYKELKKPDSGINAINGRLANNEAESIMDSYFARKASDKKILSEDIKGKVEDKKTLEEVMAELNAIIGMTKLKKEINSLFDHIKKNSELQNRGIKVDKPAFHITLTGNPGTGKTTVARLLGSIFEGLGLLDSGHTIELDRGKVVAGYQGQTAIKTHDMVDSALGGILFIDEAYSLKNSDNDSFGQEAIDTLVARTENDRGKFICVIAGYKDKIEQQFFKANDGLKSRFKEEYRYHIDDYNAEELTQIFMALAGKQHYIVPPETMEKVTAFFKDRCARKTSDFGNGREARNLFDTALSNQTERQKSMDIATMTNDDVLTLLPQDIPLTASEKMVSIDEAMKELNELVGLKSVKDAVKKIADKLEMNKIKGETGPLRKHFVFQGNPGTGKTTVARIMADVFKAVGMLPTNNLVEVGRSKLVANIVGDTAKNVDKYCDQAMGGVLFVDEAYALQNGQYDSFGKEAIDTLIPRLENDIGKYVGILAGYTKEMEEFLDVNSGFTSRISDYIDFEDYTVAEMQEIFTRMCKKKNYEFAPGFKEALQKRLENLYAGKSRNFGNARTVRKLFDKTDENVSSRVMNMKKSGSSDEDVKREAYIMRPEDLNMTVS